MRVRGSGERAPNGVVGRGAYLTQRALLLLLREALTAVTVRLTHSSLVPYIVQCLRTIYAHITCTEVYSEHSSGRHTQR